MNLLRKVNLIVGRSHLEQQTVKNLLFKENDVFGNVLFITPNDPVYLRNRVKDKYGIVYLFDVDISFNSNDDFLRYFSDLFSEYPGVRFVIPTSNPITVELFNVMLKKYCIKDYKLDSDKLNHVIQNRIYDIDIIKDSFPLNPEDVAVYTYDTDKVMNLMDYEDGLTGNTLIEDFNDCSMLFDEVKDLEDQII